MVGFVVNFARSISATEGKARQRGVIICAEVQMDRVKEVTRSQPHTVNTSNSWWQEYVTVYYIHEDDARDEFRVKDPSQVLRWIIIVHEEYDLNLRRLQLDREFANTQCGCV